MNRGTWIIRLALFIALAGTVWGMTVMVSSASDIGVALLPPDTSWTGTWQITPHSAGTEFDRQTLREVVPAGTGGSLARVRLSNALGTTPLTIADVRVADSAGGSAIRSGSGRVVTFGGRTTATIPAGGSATSDPIPFSVVARSNVALSVYLPQATGAATAELGAQRTYVAPGDVSASTDLGAAPTIGGYYFLTGLDVSN